MEGAALGRAVGAVGRAEGAAVGSPGSIEGLAVGSALGMAVGAAVVGLRVGTELGDNVFCIVGDADGDNVEGAGVTVKVGEGVGEYVTRPTPTPEMATCPLHAVDPVQPSRMMYVCAGVPVGTVYCTCAHTLPPEMHAAGGRLPVPVSSYTTSTPLAEYTRSVVEPVQLAPAYSAPHMLTVNVCPALADTPHTGSLPVSVLV